MKKILVVSESLGEPNHKRGIFHFTRELIRSLADEGHELTLVVETTNYSRGTTFRFPVAAESLRATERFTRAAPDRIDYRFTIDDRATYTKPWTAALPLRGVPDYVIFEYACHEGNYSIRNVLSGARMQERAAVAAAARGN